MNKIIIILLIFAYGLSGCNKSISKNEQPNIIILQADDLGWDDLPLNGNSFIKTPGIDKLADQSIEISRFYVNPVCAPTRASLLTGRDFLLTGVSHVHGGKDFINLSEKTFGNIFRLNGYKTGMWGKWHSGKTNGYFPWQRGFDEAYMAELYKHKNSYGLLNGREVKSNKWSDELIVDYAIEFIKRNKEDHFLAYLSFLTCHAPLAAKEKIVEKYERMGLSKNLSTLYAMIEQMDKEINRLLDEVDSLGLSENTIIVFMSDNGPAVINNLLTDEDRKIRYANNYKGHKGNIWENGVKSPLLVSYPGKLRPSKMELLCDATDIFPTLADFAGITLDKYDLKLSGFSFANNLINHNAIRPDKYVFNYANSGWPPTNIPWSPEGVLNEYLPFENDKSILDFEPQIISLISKEYKLLKNPSNRVASITNEEEYALINLNNDPLENKNISSGQSEIYEKLKTKLQDKYKEIVESKNSFEPIEFKVSEDAESKILLYAPKLVSGDLSVAFNYTYSWNKRGMVAEYLINSDSNVLVQPSIIKEGNALDIEYEISILESNCGAKSISGDKIVFENIIIPKGKNILKVKVKSSYQNKSSIKFSEMVLKPIRD
ncbi:MAG: sulfatase-like hydrolase/transferase [Melioribacteraceae bacterium]|nr:sulfatase-like hydrolase/transferase [Melioribacteraceae bacterium]